MIKMSNVSNFYEGVTKKFNVTISYNGSNPDITSDTVNFIMKSSKSDDDANAAININADVTAGSSGVASFTLASSDTVADPKTYYYEISWTLSTGEFYILDNDTVIVLNRITDL